MADLLTRLRPTLLNRYKLEGLSEATGRQTLTTAGVALDRPAYMSPERASGDFHTDHRADIYARDPVATSCLPAAGRERGYAQNTARRSKIPDLETAPCTA